ncbi:hypothetical protein OG196_06805 [Kitasatospora purpeofusca]|nr:hypothetical protein [Kitasatospora purpeofusca]MCX4759001.1 hypothetical protein [Kitasatospora purpeofusca]WSR30580.1 hypothetical protein OG715_06160 [Kitasatospora purpeofusca]WSR38820.1 hypothetical protein OG196_06805 [Kitasatospora purpeofusca]
MARDPVRAGDPGEQLHGLVVAQHVQRHTDRAVQSGHAPPGRHQDQAARVAGDQRADLRGVDGVVQHQQVPLARRPAAPQLGALLGVRRQRVLADTDRPEQVGQRRARFERRLARSGAAQVHEELSVGEAVGEGVSDVDGQGGLADPGHAVDGGDDQRTGPGAARSGGQGQQPVHLLAPSGEVRDGVRQQPGHHLLRRRLPGWLRLRLAAGRGEQPVAVGGLQPEGGGQPRHRGQPGPPAPRLQHADRMGGEARLLREFLLRPPGRVPVLPQQRSEVPQHDRLR